MSAIYITEPPTNGKVVLTTTHGDIDIELWPKEAPKAVRNFVQLYALSLSWVTPALS
jgi:peptidyl-prolyl cis-trans isomerase SDCCAG10